MLSLEHLHPFIAHFPIAFGTLVVILAIWVFFKKDHIGYLTIMFILTFLAIIGAQIAGHYAILGKLTPEVEALVEEQAVWNIYAFWVALVGCFISMIAWMTYLRNHTIWERLFIILTLVFALGTCWTVFEATIRQDALVFDHGVGVRSVGTDSVEWRASK
ncbi:MAG: hypothetical protein SP1CHLAM54_03220 [Chlamydiia bacterium]|nr:hypothetical protein [Chlamydiia bacterium]MCH9615238.1 hypothetical protein [Chlamydiia bacterium]MCH9628440.1 hypothetical protein [Chlamydiia bacterium]